MRDRLIELIKKSQLSVNSSKLADYLLENGVIVPLCNVGDTVYFLLEDDIPVHKWFISEEKVTEICSKGFFTSGYLPPKDDLGDYTLWDEIGKTVFLTEEEAEKA